MHTRGASGRVESVNRGPARDRDWAGRMRRTAIDKRSAAGPVRVGTLGLEGDEIADTKRHGGPYQAVYAFAREDLDRWAGLLGAPVAAGVFGENLTTVGIDVNEALLGERWRVGTALLQVVAVRIPCGVFKAWLGVAGFDNDHWVRRFTEEARPGPYLRVLEQGVVAAGDPIVVEHRPDHGVSVSTMFRALTTEPALLPLLLEVPELPPVVHERARDHVARTARTLASIG